MSAVRGPSSVVSRQTTSGLLPWYWRHLRDMGVAGRSHSRESGNLLRQPLQMPGELDSRFRGNDQRFERDPRGGAIGY